MLEKQFNNNNNNGRTGNRSVSILKMIKNKSAKKLQHHEEFYPLPSQISEAAAAVAESSSQSSSCYDVNISISFQSVLSGFTSDLSDDEFSLEETSIADDELVFDDDDEDDKEEEDIFSLKHHHSHALLWRIKKQQRRRREQRRARRGNKSSRNSASASATEIQDYFEQLCIGDEVLVFDEIEEEEEDFYSTEHYHSSAMRRKQPRKRVQQVESIEEIKPSSSAEETNTDVRNDYHNGLNDEEETFDLTKNLEDSSLKEHEEVMKKLILPVNKANQSTQSLVKQASFKLDKLVKQESFKFEKLVKQDSFRIQKLVKQASFRSRRTLASMAA